MNKKIIRIIHPIAGSIAFLTILTFWLSTVYSKLLGSDSVILTVKTMILYGLIILIPAMITVGATGGKLGQHYRHEKVKVKKKRMPFIAMNGIFILIPCAVILYIMASKGQYTTNYNIIQGVELVAGSVNLTLLGLNMRDGLIITKKLKRQ